MNYQIMMDEELDKIKQLGKKPTLLLHACCAPCSSYVLEYLSSYFDITILYYNPNIEPYEEYLKRKEEQINYIKDKGINFMDSDYDNELFKEISKYPSIVKDVSFILNNNITPTTIKVTITIVTPSAKAQLK